MKTRISKGDILQDLSRGGKGYWKGQNVFATIYFGPRLSFDPVLNVAYKAKFGYFLTVELPSDGERVAYIAIGKPGQDDRVAKLNLGQSRIAIPQYMFISEIDMTQAVGVFCDTGGLDESLCWIRKDESNWQFYPDDE